MSCVALLAVLSLSAQLNLSLGPSAGFGHTWMSGGAGKSLYQPAGNFGLSAIYSTNSKIGIGADLKYSIEGGRSEIGNAKNEARIDYLRVPIHVIYFFNDYGDQIRPKISVGPSFGFLLGGKNFENEVETGSIKDLVKGFDFGLQATAGLHARLVRNTWLIADVGYYHGLTDVSEGPLTNRNRNIQINLGVAFGIGKLVN